MSNFEGWGLTLVAHKKRKVYLKNKVYIYRRMPLRFFSQELFQSVLFRLAIQFHNYIRPDCYYYYYFYYYYYYYHYSFTRKLGEITAFYAVKISYEYIQIKQLVANTRHTKVKKKNLFYNLENFKNYNPHKKPT